MSKRCQDSVEQCLGKSGSSRSGSRGMSKRHVVKPWNKLSAGSAGFRRRIRAESPNCSLERTGSPVRTAAFDVIPAGLAPRAPNWGRSPVLDIERREFITLLGGAAIFVYLLSRTFFPMAVRTYSSC
jgi:hypothetical protein